MTYTTQEKYDSKNMVPGSQADNVWHLGARRVTSITIHHWGLKGQQFDTVRDFLCTNDTPTSAHYVAQDGLVACIVSPDDCAFHAGSAEGNTFSIGIECRPEATDGDYATVAELIAKLRAIYGDIPLYPHNHWFNTSCPGDYDLTRLDALARGTITTQGTITEGFLMALNDQDQQNIYQAQGRIDAGVAKLLDAVTAIQAATANIPLSVLTAQFRTKTGAVANVANTLAEILAKPAAVTNVTSAPAAVDVDALVARLKAELPAAVLAELTTKLTQP